MGDRILYNFLDTDRFHRKIALQPLVDRQRLENIIDKVHDREVWVRYLNRP